MKVGAQTICWGSRIDNLEGVIASLASLGYEGIEVAQTPDQLGVKSIYELLALLRAHKMELVGLAGGSLLERMEFCETFRPRYLYIESWDNACSLAQKRGFKLALHPHLFKPIFRIGHAAELLNEHPNLKFILDTAHLTIAGDDPVEALKLTRGRLASVHAKDWKPIYGRHSYRYAKGFTELGSGVLGQKIANILKSLQNDGFDGWLFWEQDYSSSDPIGSAQESANWLHLQGVMAQKARLSTRARRHLKNNDAATPGIHVYGESPQILQNITDAGTKEPDQCYAQIAKTMARVVPSDLVTVWRCTTSQNVISLLASLPSIQVTNHTLNYDECLCYRALERQKVTIFDFADENNCKLFGHPELLARFRLKRMVSVPILNPWNLNHVVLVVNLFPCDPVTPRLQVELFQIGRDVAFAVDSSIDEHCAAAAGTAQHLALTAESSGALLEGMKDVLLRDIDCDGLAVFITDESETKLELEATSGTEWTVPEDERFYRLNQGITGRVWASGAPFLTSDARHEKGWLGKSRESASEAHYSCLWYPLVQPGGDVIGVVRCSDKRGTVGIKIHRAFSDDDIAVIDAVAQATVPQYILLATQERRTRALGRLTHELKTPVVAVRGAAESMRETPGVKDFFEHDYPGDVWSWSELMRGLLDNIDHLRYGEAPPSPRKKRTFLMRDVIAPAAKQVGLLLDEHGFDRGRIIYGRLVELPPLSLDRHQFQQVAFNLFANSIKYSFEENSRFKIEVTGQRTMDGFEIHFSDRGPGFEPGMEKSVFKEGIRGAYAVDNHIRGEGLGLWVVSRIVEGTCASPLRTRATMAWPLGR